MPGETNYIHEAEIWRQRLKTEVEQAAQWHDNWGFLAGREQGEPRGFSEKVAKYSYGHAQWSVSSVRVPDNTEEGIAAAMSEQNARKLMSTLKWDTLPATETKKCLMPSGPNKVHLRVFAREPLAQLCPSPRFAPADGRDALNSYCCPGPELRAWSWCRATSRVCQLVRRHS